MSNRDVKRNPGNRISVLEQNLILHLFGKRNLNLFISSLFCQGNYIKITKCQVKLIHIFV